VKILLTGATGFLGKYVIDELKNNSYQVVAFGRNEKIGKTLIDENVEFFKGDIDNLVAMDRLVNQSEYRRVENAIKKAGKPAQPRNRPAMPFKMRCTLPMPTGT